VLGRNESAASILEEAVKRNPDDSTDRVGLAFTLGELGREEDAKRTVATILGLDLDLYQGSVIEAHRDGLPWFSARRARRGDAHVSQ